MKFEEKLIMLRKQKLFSQEEMAEQLNVTRQTISKWELGQSKPDMDKLGEISKYFNLDINALVNDNEEIQIKQSNIINAKKNGTERKGLLYLLLFILIAAIITLFVRINIENKNNKNRGISGILNSLFKGVEDIAYDIQQETNYIVNSDTQEFSNMVNSITQEYNNIVDSMTEQSNKSQHNLDFTNCTGTKAFIFVESNLDNIITINKTTPEHSITVIYSDISTIDEQQIKNIKKSLSEWNKYEISTEYDENGYVYKYIIENL